MNTSFEFFKNIHFKMYPISTTFLLKLNLTDVHHF